MRGYQSTPLGARWVSRPAQLPFGGSTFPVLIVCRLGYDQQAACVPFRGAEETPEFQQAQN